MTAVPVLFPAGVQALRDAPLAWALLVGGAVIFAGVMLLLALAAGPRARSIRPRWWLVGGGLVLPGVVLAALQVFNLRHIDSAPHGNAAMAAMAADELVVSISARLWWWELRYTDPATGAPVVSANELRLPVGRAVRLGLSSDDMIHSLWIPALAGKVDLVPGRVAQLQLQVQRAGVWRAPCAEFCGEAHARMVLHAVAQPAADFDAWLAQQALPARSPNTALQRQGQAAFISHGCAACHTVRGVAVAVLPGPDLTHLASRLHIGAGSLPNGQQTLRRWIADVQLHKPGARMPSFNSLDAATLDALAAYLSNLQ